MASFPAAIASLYSRGGSELNNIRLTLIAFGWRNWLAASLGAIISIALIGLPSVLIPNPFFTRQTPVRPQDYGFWIATSLLLGLVVGTYVSPVQQSHHGKAMGGGILSFLAVGCPICNKLVVALLGISGALAFFEPAQLYLGIASLVLLIWTVLLRARLFASGACPLPSQKQTIVPDKYEKDMAANT